MEIRLFTHQDCAVISAAFMALGWNTPVEQYEKYFEEQQSGERDVFIATVGEEFAGYATIHWSPPYQPFKDADIPELRDLNVLPKFRRQGVGTALIKHAEDVVSPRSDTIGIGVGMYPDYGNAQRLYVQLGYIPDGRGLTYRAKPLLPMEATVNDDDLVLFFTKELKV
ncbi:MAG: GNAT family N-acetyltransferase [Alphaproteobacteria bacterium]|nr:MAG: GNAT family N-acetyltransferase [Alphaproteobacteria bacterium]